MESDKVFSEAQAEVWSLAHSYLKSMSLKCALDLGIPDAICSNGQAMSLSQLRSALQISISKTSQLRRLMRFLTHFGFFVEMNDDAGTEPVYDLTAQSRLLITWNDKPTNLLPFACFHLDEIVMKPSLYMSDWFTQEEKSTPFELAHGRSIWDLTSQNPSFNKVLNKAMVSAGGSLNDVMIKHGGDVFEGVSSLVDVGGGKGAMAEVIAKNFPHVNCTVLDLPQVVHDTPDNGLVKFVSGDMFHYVPPADVVLLKWILHDWSDKSCIKILRRCKDAIPSKEAGGKVLVVDAIVGSTSSVSVPSDEQHLLDMLMLTLTEGAERDEKEWQVLFTEAGFSSYRVVCSNEFLSIMEVYP